MEPSKVGPMADRVDGLEAEVGRLRRGAVIPILMTLAVAVFAALSRPRAGRPLTVGSVEIRDNEGRLRGTFGVDAVGLPGLKLFDHRGLEQVTLAIPSDDTSALYFAERGSPRLLLESSIHGSSTLRFVDAQDRDGAMLFLAPDGSTRLSLADGEWEAHAGSPGASDDRLTRTAPTPALIPRPASSPIESPTIPVPSVSVQSSKRRPVPRSPLSSRMPLPQ